MDLALSPIKQYECSPEIDDLERGCETCEGLSMVLDGYNSD